LSTNFIVSHSQFAIEIKNMVHDTYDFKLKLNDLLTSVKFMMSNYYLVISKEVNESTIVLKYKKNGGSYVDTITDNVQELLDMDEPLDMNEDKLPTYNHPFLEFEVKKIKKTFEKFQQMGSERVTISVVDFGNNNFGLLLASTGSNNFSSSRIISQKDNDDEDQASNESPKMKSKNLSTIISAEYNFSETQKVFDKMSNLSVKIRVGTPLIVHYAVGESSHMKYWVLPYVEDDE